MNYLTIVRRTFVEYGSNIPYNLPIVSFGASITCSLARRNYSFPDICKILQISKLSPPLKEE